MGCAFLRIDTGPSEEMQWRGQNTRYIYIYIVGSWNHDHELSLSLSLSLSNKKTSQILGLYNNI
jgi:hypothetical protein